MNRNLTYIVLLWLFLFSCSPQKKPAGYSSLFFTSEAPYVPIIKGVQHNAVLRLSITMPKGADPIRIRHIRLHMNKEAGEEVESITAYNNDSAVDLDLNKPSFTTRVRATAVDVSVKIDILPGVNNIWVTAKLRNNAPLDGGISIVARELVDQKGKKYKVAGIGHDEAFTKRKGIAIRRRGDKNADTYRIPGLITTKRGTLIAVYDVRYDNNKDLPGNIDVGMSRSVDGGNSWEQMRIIMDMNKPNDENGIGDPCILYDPKTERIFVAALWSKGNRSIQGSGPGLSPDESGQLMITESIDDGKTWSSKPKNITADVKDPKWKIFFQAPGNGISMSDGTLVFPAQYWDEKGMPWSTIIYSEDHGFTWKRGKGAKINTTESQVVETERGTLMLNMRDNRGKFRSVSTTKDLGNTWTEHPTSANTLPDPICMAGLIKAELNWKGSMKEILLFSNPANDTARINMTVRTSEDLGMSWSKGLLIDERKGYGYSVMTRINEQMVGLLYEGNGDLYFMRIPVKDLR